MRINPTLLSLSRTIHIYLTMLGLLVMLGFGVTGFTANHEDWFGATRPHVTESEGRTPLPLIESRDALRIVEHLRQAFHITGAMSGYEDMDDRLSIGFKSPGESWEVEVEKAGGRTTLHHEAFNTIAVLNNLHRGRYTGPAWSWVVDLSALLIVLACLTGVILWLALPRRRRLGIVFLVLGTILTVGIVWFRVPGPGLTPGSTPTDATEAVEPGSSPAPDEPTEPQSAAETSPAQP